MSYDTQVPRSVGWYTCWIGHYGWKALSRVKWGGRDGKFRNSQVSLNLSLFDALGYCRIDSTEGALMTQCDQELYESMVSRKIRSPDSIQCHTSLCSNSTSLDAAMSSTELTKCCYVDAVWLVWATIRDISNCERNLPSRFYFFTRPSTCSDDAACISEW